MFGFKKGFDKDEYRKIDLPEEDESYLEDHEGSSDEEADADEESVSLSEMFKSRLMEKGASEQSGESASSKGESVSSPEESGGSEVSMSEFFKAKMAAKESGALEKSDAGYENQEGTESGTGPAIGAGSGAVPAAGNPSGTEKAQEYVNEPEEEIESEDGYDEYEEEEKEVPSWLRWLKRIVLGIVILTATMLMTFGFSLYREFSNDKPREGKEVEVEIPKGCSTEKMAEILQDAGVIRYKTAFLAKLFFSDYRGKLRYGTFTINTGETLDETIEILGTGGALKEEVSFMVPEGYSVEMIAEKLQKDGIMDSEEFLDAVTEAADDFVYKDQLPDKDRVFYQLQGYLFPDTYKIAENMTGKQLVDKMLDGFVRKFDEKRQKQAKKLGMSVEEVVIRASLVQKETYNPKDYAKIAGVIDNRLEKGMKLQFDSTVVYAISNGLFGVEKVTYDDLERESPYNTYHVRGLPPGPICNPGLDAIDGVLNAEEHNYLFFRTDPNKDDGSNIFTETYEEHSAAGEETEAVKEETKKETKEDTKKETKEDTKKDTKKETKEDTADKN